MARPLWSGSIQISLVGFAVEIYPATQTTKPFTFHEIDRSTLTRVRRQSVSPGPSPSVEPAVDPEEIEEPAVANKTAVHFPPQPQGKREDASVAPVPMEHAVDRADIVKGFEYESGKYAIIEPAELKNLQLPGKKTIEISQFAKAAEIDPVLYEKPYFVMPKACPQATAFAVVRQAMRESGMVGVGDIVFSGRQHLMTLAPPNDPNQPGMMLYTLRFGAELRDAREYSNNVETVKPDQAQLNLAKQLIEAYRQPFNLANFKDQYEEALRELVEAKMHNLPVPQPEVEKRPTMVVDLMDALRKSLLQKKPVQSVKIASEQVEPEPVVKGTRTRAAAKDVSTMQGKARVGRPVAGSKKSKSA
jgi:DNA end-binding protein Ku